MYSFNKFTLGYDDPLFEEIEDSISEGELIHLQAPGGTGKTTMLHALGGILSTKRKQWGEVTVYDDYKPIQISGPSQMGLTGASPEQRLFCNSVEEEITWALEGIGLSKDEAQNRSKTLCEYFELDPRSAPAKLSGGQQKLLELASYLAINPRILLLDEPFINLDQHNSRLVSHAILQYKNQGTSIIIADHILPENLKTIARKITLTPLTSNDIPKSPECPCTELYPAKEVLVLKDISFGYGSKELFSELCLSVKGGDILQLKGKNGAGKTTLLKICAGLISNYAGKMSPVFDSWKVQSKYIGAALQNPDSQFYCNTVDEELKADCDLAWKNWLVSVLGLKHKLLESPLCLSHGEKKRLQLALACINKPKILLLDEPDAGLDKTYKQTCIQLLQQLSKIGIAILFTSHCPEFSSQLTNQEFELEA